MQRLPSTRTQVDSDASAGNGKQRMYFLSDKSYGCEVEGGAVILDLGTGGYVGVDAGNLAVLRDRIANWPKTAISAIPTTRPASGESERLIAALLARGTVTTSPVPKRPSLPAVAGEALAPEVDRAIGLSWMKHAPHLATSLLEVSLRHRDRRLVPLLAWLNYRQRLIHRAGCHPPLEDVRRLLVSFFSLRIWLYTADRHCLFDSLVLSMFLTRKRVPCTFVIGVSTKPFTAHAWVQSADRVLNDTAEHVQMFIPILAAGE
jgi:transglutaminase superfamily protein